MKKVKGLLVVVTALFVITGSVAVDSISAEASNIPVGNCTSEEWKVIKLVNKERLKKGLKPISTFTKLQKAADIRAKELDTLYSHTRPNGKSSNTILAEVGIKPDTSCGENIAKGDATAEEVMYGYGYYGWMYSAGHKAAILDSDRAHVSAGYYNPPTSNPVCWVQLFLDDWYCGTTTIAVKDGDKVSSCKKGTWYYVKKKYKLNREKSHPFLLVSTNH